jgi:2-polyprenyl-3-methyl-5-hydroxy-6-metoxy-1,4-benzoquinol methylase
MSSDAFQLTRQLSGEPAAASEEIWTLAGSGEIHSWPVRVRYHKPMEILKLKPAGAQPFLASAERMARERTALFARDTEHVEACPVCGAPSAKATEELVVYGGRYVRCPGCTHRYVINRLSRQALEDFYRTNRAYQATYTQRDAARTRIREIHQPKLDWLCEQYRRIYGDLPRAILDVGAGSGHFCACCRDAGLVCDGVELSESGRAFAREVFGLSLRADDVLEKAGEYAGRYDVVTFWGLIEHVPQPGAMLAAARRILETSTRPMVIASVPRWNSVSSVIQAAHPDRVVRHLDPLGHVQCFTETSACVLFLGAGLRPEAAWYFGMDAYELLLHLAAASGSDALMNSSLIASLQQTFDLARLSDSMILAARPAGNKHAND